MLVEIREYMTCSACRSSDGGITRPGALGACRLITGSNLMGRSTG
jgi:hypothetical protein